MVDTANDYRILMALHAVDVLRRRVSQWGLPWPIKKRDALEAVEEARRRLLRVRYSFLPSDMLADSDDVEYVVGTARRLASLLLPETRPSLRGGQELAFAEVRWALSVLAGLRERILLGDANRPEWAVDVVGVRVVRVEPAPEGEGLRVTRASAGRAAFTIVTNLRDVRVGEVRAAAILPPAVVGGVVSEAMYSSGPLDGRYLGKRVPSRLLSSELAGVIRRILEGR